MFSTSSMQIYININVICCDNFRSYSFHFSSIYDKYSPSVLCLYNFHFSNFLGRFLVNLKTNIITVVCYIILCLRGITVKTSCYITSDSLLSRFYPCRLVLKIHVYYTSTRTLGSIRFNDLNWSFRSRSNELCYNFFDIKTRDSLLFTYFYS